MNKTVLISGAGSGFGLLAALRLSERGHRVIATTETEAQAVALRETAPQLRVEKLDVTTPDVRKVVDWDVEVLINNAGVGETGPLADMPMDRIRHLFEVNVFGTLALTQAVLPAMVERRSGRIIIMSSIAGVIPAPGFGPYAMTKHALEAMGKTMRMELAPLGIDVTLINPGPFQTGFNDRMANSMWEWFDEKSLNASAAELFRVVGGFVTTGQRDPSDVAEKLVELVEAQDTSENNFVPPDIRAQLGLT
ncbi:MAG: SDR family oxidoreductase [Acidimicrobiaceae bacterium]|nr:SDR family oxidoreductase [Acidimicrobiaceae bacterium]